MKMRKQLMFTVVLVLMLALSLGGCKDVNETKPFDGTVQQLDQDGTDEVKADPEVDSEGIDDTDDSSEEDPKPTEPATESGEGQPGEGSTEEVTAEIDIYITANDTVYALDRLNVRASESTEADILGVLEVGQAVNRTGIHEQWTRIIYEGREAFVATAYISEVKPTEPETDVPFVSAEGTGIYYDNGGYLVAIDPGHQGKGNSDKEPVGPGASEMKAKVSSGTQGVVTGIPEHEMNLVVSLYLRDELLTRGYSVLMIRETKDVDISNAERAQLANSYNSDIFVRIHGNSVSNQEIKGALTMCMTENNPYNGNLHMPSRVLSQAVVDGLCAATGAVNKGIQETDTMSGINWCTIPVTIVEMGFMSNPEEDRAMAADSYRRALAKGIADGIDAYFGRK